MKCLSCDKVLSDYEATRKYASSETYVDLCNRCLSTIENFPPTIERSDLFHEEVVEGEEE